MFSSRKIIGFIIGSILTIDCLIAIPAMAACAPIDRQPADPKWLNFIASLEKQGRAGNSAAYYQLYLLLPWEVLRENYCVGFNYDKFNVLKAAAEMGHVLAQYELGNFYQYHNFFLISRYHIFSKELWEEYRKPQLPDIQAGEPWEEYKERNKEIFIAIDQHPYKKVDERRDAVTWYKKAIAQGFVPAIYQLGKFYTSRNPEQALDLLMKAAELGNLDANQELLKIKEGEVKLSYDDEKEKTFKWLWEQSQQGNLYAISQLIAFWRDSEDVYSWLKDQIVKDNQYIANHFAKAIIKEEYYNNKFSYMAPHVYKLAIKDSDLAQLWMANYEENKGDRISALKWLKRAMASGNKKALNEYYKYNWVGRRMSESLVLSDSQQKAISDYYGTSNADSKPKKIVQDRKYKRVYYDEQLVTDATNGKAESEYQLGLAYEIGEGVKEDMQQAMHWYKKAAKQGNKQAIYRIESLYNNPFSGCYNSQ